MNGFWKKTGKRFSSALLALVLVLSALGLTGMWLAVFADVGVMVLAVLNAMRV